ncbi:MAG: class I SAM-dependent methyltransferase [Parcubacteria group bacterium]|nr:class I SAM-dependent methyltransferase [Parcubacteria group bacterium]
MMQPDNSQARTAELVEGGSWFNYFQKKSNPFWDRMMYTARMKRFASYYDGFHERYLRPDDGPLIELGVGFGATAIPLIDRGFSVIGIDNEPRFFPFCVHNSQFSEHPERLTLVLKDLYDPNWHRDFLKRSIQAVVSYGVLEHFERNHLINTLIPQQFAIAKTIIAMIPVLTENTLQTFKATSCPENNVDENGIYRNFWTTGFWRETIFKGHEILGELDVKGSGGSKGGPWDMTIFTVQ